MRTPWGKAQSVETILPGVMVVSTAGHGGIKLDTVRNAKVPKDCRRRGGWYEEDCDVYIVFAVHADVRRHFNVTEETTALGLAQWMPLIYGDLVDAGIVKATIEANAALAKHLVEKAKLLHCNLNNIPVRCSALGLPDGRIHVLFNVPNKRDDVVGFFMSKETYDAIPLLVPATPDDYREHGTLEPAPTNFY
jgi:hypothetical protein